MAGSLRRDRLTDVDRWLARLDEFRASGLRRLGEHLDGQPCSMAIG